MTRAPLPLLKLPDIRLGTQPFWFTVPFAITSKTIARTDSRNPSKSRVPALRALGALGWLSNFEPKADRIEISQPHSRILKTIAREPIYCPSSQTVNATLSIFAVGDAELCSVGQLRLLTARMPSLRNTLVSLFTGCV